MLKTLISGVIIVLCLSLLLGVLILYFGISDQPDISNSLQLTHEDITRAKRILHEGVTTKPDEINTIELTQADLNLAANYLLNRYITSTVNIELKPNVLRFKVTTTLPKNSLGHYLNISFRLGNDQENVLPSLTKFKAGKLLLPAKLAALVVDNIIRYTSLNNYFILATRPIQTIKIDPDKISIRYYSTIETLAQAKKFLARNNNNPDIDIYQAKIADIVKQHDPNWRLSLAELLKPLFQLALQRSTIDTAINENKLVIMAINNYVNTNDTQKLLALPNINATKPEKYPTFLYKRIDLAQHFIASATITASVNGQVATIIGEEKELSDSNGGSGFSFIDLTADKAGTRFGELATATPESARRLQQAMANIKDYTDFMPNPNDLPEHMNDAEFKERYQSVNSENYQKLSKEIDERIISIPLYH